MKSRSDRPAQAHAPGRRPSACRWPARPRCRRAFAARGRGCVSRSPRRPGRLASAAAPARCVSSSAMRPSSIRITRSASATASCTSCVTSKAVKRWRCHRLSISRCISMRVSASSAPSGSSSSSRRGWCTSARASDTRWRWPPDSRAGHSRRGRPGRPAPALPCRAHARSARQAQRHVVEHAAPGQQARLLEHDPRVVVQAVDGLAVGVERAVGGCFEAGDQAQQVLLPQPLRPTMATNSPGSMASCVLRSTSRAP